MELEDQPIDVLSALFGSWELNVFVYLLVSMFREFRGPSKLVQEVLRGIRDIIPEDEGGGEDEQSLKERTKATKTEPLFRECSERGTIGVILPCNKHRACKGHAVHFTTAARAMKFYQANNIVDDDMILTFDTEVFRPIEDDEYLDQLEECPICGKRILHVGRETFGRTW